MKIKCEFLMIILASFIVVLGNLNIVSANAEELDEISNSIQNDVSYPYEEVMIVGSTGNNLNAEDDLENVSINTKSDMGEISERFRFSTVDGVNFKIISMKNNYVLTLKHDAETNDNFCDLKPESDNDSELWQIIGVDKDVNGDYYNYKIVSEIDNYICLTEDTDTNSISLSEYSQGANQKWKLNCSGIVGFAGYSKDSNGQNKTGTIGGLLGRTVIVRDFDSLKKALDEEEPLTIVVAEDIDCSAERIVTKIDSNKTLVGSYSANKLINPRFQTDDPYSVQEVGNNIILKNLSIEVNRGGLINISVYGTRNLWIDHCYFNSVMDVDADEVGKFIWINYSGSRDVDPDFYTISYCKFQHRYWAVTFGAKSTTKNHGTVAYNYFDSCVRRTPETGNGKLHALNNYIKRDLNDKNSPYAAILGCYEAHIYSEGNRFEGFHRLESGYGDKELGATYVKDVGSYTDWGREEPTEKSYPLAQPKDNAVTTFNPADSYSYKAISAYDNINGDDIKKFCLNHCGTVSDYSKLTYID